MKKFQRKIEDFTCGHCHAKVKGNGYTNHCPRCLWSKHVDVNPGDRLETCDGMMKPVGIQLNHGEQILVHKCQICGLQKNNKVSSGDNITALTKLSETFAKNSNF